MTLNTWANTGRGISLDYVYMQLCVIVKVRRLCEARVNGGSKYDSLNTLKYMARHFGKLCIYTVVRDCQSKEIV